MPNRQGNEVYGGGETSAGIFLHRSSDDAIVIGEEPRAHKMVGPTERWSEAFYIVFTVLWLVGFTYILPTVLFRVLSVDYGVAKQ